MTTAQLNPIEQHFVGKGPIVRATYNQIVALTRQFGPVREDAKKTSIHLANKAAFAGVQTQKQALNLIIRSNVIISSPRIRKVEQVSAGRYHLLIKLARPEEIDGELREWLHQAYLQSQ
ncbi:MAG: hypothetical protein NVS4B8_20170 [Herpetosiphon sp.]